MTKWLKIALGNLLKNRRRSLVTIFGIAVGFISVSLFSGYIHNTYNGLRNTAIKGEGLGHLTIYKKGWLLKGKFDPDKYMFSSEELGKVQAMAQNNDDIILVTPRLNVSGLLSNGRTSTIFIASGVVATDEEIIKGDWGKFRQIQGDTLTEQNEYGVEMAGDLAKIMGMKPGSNGVVMVTTPDGQMNALDIEVAGIFDTGSQASNDKFMRVPFSFAQSLYETEKADEIVVLLKSWQKTETVRTEILEELSRAGLECEIKTWEELSMFYSKVRSMFGMIFLFIFLIVFVVVSMSVVNTMGMAVIERTREIGTLRAIGVKRKGISVLFAMEGVLLGLIGSVVGAIVHSGICFGIQRANLSYVPPGNSSSVPLVVDLLPANMLGLAFFLIVLSLIAAILPARRAAKLNIVEALGHV